MKKAANGSQASTQAPRGERVGKLREVPEEIQEMGRKGSIRRESVNVPGMQKRERVEAQKGLAPKKRKSGQLFFFFKQAVH